MKKDKRIKLKVMRPPDNIYICYRGDEVGIVTRESYRTGDFNLTSFDGISVGNSWSFVKTPNFDDLLRKIQRENFKIKIFNSMIDVCEWMVKSYK